MLKTYFLLDSPLMFIWLLLLTRCHIQIGNFCLQINTISYFSNLIYFSTQNEKYVRRPKTNIY